MIPQLLITDDDPAFRDAVAEALTRRGLGVCQAADGRAAVRMLCQTRVDMILMDFNMPGGENGLQVIEQLPADRIPPWVLVSGQIDETIRAEAARLRAYRVLDKPVRLKQINDVVCRGLAEVYGWVAPAA